MASSEPDTTTGFSFSDGASSSSLFEGMVLFDPSSSAGVTKPQPLDPPESPTQPPSPTPSSSSAATSLPLDEDLFSDLTLLSSPPVPSPKPSPTPPPVPSRQIPRKKKRGGVRVGYARESGTNLIQVKEKEPSSVSSEFRSEVLEIDGCKDRSQKLSASAAESGSENTSVGISDAETNGKERLQQEEEEEDAYACAEKKLESIRAQIGRKLAQIREKAVSVAYERKECRRKRRDAEKEVNAKSARYKELERELEEACTREDFERAEIVSQTVQSVEVEKNKVLEALRMAEADLDSVDSRMQDVLEMRIEAEEEAKQLLEQFAKDSADNADLLLKNAKLFSVKELEAWEKASEALETKKMEIDVESHLMDEASSGLQDSMDQLIQDDFIEKERLSVRKDGLAKELVELLRLVRLKETEIEENNGQLQVVEKRISNAANTFQESQSNIKKKQDDLHSALSKTESDYTSLCMRKNNIDEHFKIAERIVSKLREIESVSTKEARTCYDSVELRKRLASPILRSREEKLRLIRLEEGTTADIQILRLNILASRSSLQELSSNRSSIQEEVEAMKQRIAFIDKRGPELEAEKKVAAAARNFKEAGRISVEARALGTEKESIQNKMANAISDLDDLEKKISSTLNNIEKNEGLITIKEKEAARATLDRLRLNAASARAESFAAITLGDAEEGDNLLREAEAAEAKADELQKTYDFEVESINNACTYHISLALVMDLPGESLLEVASSLNPMTTDDS